MRSASQTWKTKDGRVVPIDKMSDEHLENTFIYLVAKFRKSCNILWVPNVYAPHNVAFISQKLHAMYDELDRRGMKPKPGADGTYANFDDLFGGSYLADDRGAGDSTGLLNNVFVTAESARTVKVIKNRVKKFSIKLGDG